VFLGQRDDASGFLSMPRRRKDTFKVAGRSISGWIPSLKTGAAVRQPFCSQIEEHLMLRLEFTKC
jgi:hypothetical protein